LDEESVLSEHDESGLHQSHFGPSRNVARSESIIDDETQFAGDVQVPDGFGNLFVDTRSQSRNRIAERLGQCSSSIIDSASEGEDDSKDRYHGGLSGGRERHMLSDKIVASSRSSENRHISIATTAIRGTGAFNQETDSRARNASPHHWMLPVFPNLTLNRQFGDKTTCPMIAGVCEESRKSFESIISGSSMMSGIIDD
jgi:hypothetical protein